LKHPIGFLLVGLLVLAGSVGATTPALTNRNDFGLGFMLGEPSGLDAQFFWSQKSAIDVNVAWSWKDWFFVAADYQVYNKLADSPPEWRWYYGLGGYLTTPHNEDGTLGLRVPLGVKYRFPNSPVDIWGEIDPALQLVPDTTPELQGGIGVTFWLR
jgi:hypothetical protein